MIRIDYKKTMPFDQFVTRYSQVCPSHIKRDICEDTQSYYVLVKEPIHIHQLALSDAAHIIGREGISLLPVIDIKFYEGTLS